MTQLLIGLVLLIGVHLIPSIPAMRQQLAARLGEWPYKGAFSLLSLIGLYLIILGMGKAPNIQLWQPPDWGRLVPQALMLPVFILLVAAYVPGNLKRLTPNPMLWGVTLWSVSHLLANGDLPSVILFAALGLYALYAMFSANRRGAKPIAERGPILGDAVALLSGVVLYALIFLNHAALFGVPVAA
jgi:uncharacterized membrane protein